MFGFKLCIFAILGAVWEPNSAFCYIRGCLGDKFCIFTVLGANFCCIRDCLALYSAFCCIRGYLGAKFCIFCVLGVVWL